MGEPAGASGRRLYRQTITRNLPGLLGAVLLVGFIAGGIFPRAFTSHPADLQDIDHRLAPPTWSFAGTGHVLGTDQLGRDLLARILAAGRVSLLVGVVAVVCAGGIGALLGILAGYYGRLFETLVMGFADILLSIPFVLLAIVVAAVLGPGLRNVLVVLTITGWVLFARVMHAKTLTVRQLEFVEASRALGASDPWILRYHVLPQLLSPLIVVVALQAGRMMLAEAAISFLGLGIEASRPGWGTMLGTSRDYIWTAPWIITLPGLAITLTVLGINLAGESLRMLLDPRSRLQGV